MVNIRRVVYIFLAIAVILPLIIIGCYRQKPRKYVGSVDIDVSDSTLNMFTGQNKEALLRYLASSSDWWLTRISEIETYRGKLGAVKRISIAETDNGHLSYNDRIILSFEKYDFSGIHSPRGWRPEEGEYETGYVGGPPISLKIYEPLYDQPGLESYLVINGKEISLDIREQLDNKDRRFTVNAIKDVNNKLGLLLRSSAVKEKGYDETLLAKDSVKTCKDNEIGIKTGLQPGIYIVSGYLNPGEKGYIYLKVFNTETKQEVMLPLEQTYTIEYVGWSDNPDEKFYFNVVAMCKVGDWEHEFLGRFEVWFVPANNSAERLLIQTSHKIYGWER